MSSSSRAFALLLPLVGACKEKPAEQKPSEAAAPSPMDLAQAPKLELANSGPPTLPFTIVQAYDAQQPTAVAPWHAAGGAWTFFDATTAHGTRLTFGIAPHGPLSHDAQFLEGEGSLSSADSAALANEVASTFHIAAPVSKTHPQKPVRMHLQLIGENVDCTPSVGCNDHGTWTATKLLLGGGDIEVFFNWDVPGKRGEIVEASPDDDVTLVGILSAL